VIISTRGRYGLRAMFELAKSYGEGTLSIKQIAQAQALSEQYLEQIFGKLKNAGLVKSTRGAGGGYTLGAPPEEIRPPAPGAYKQMPGPAEVRVLSASNYLSI
jgi:Rrf2 family protein